MAIFRKTLWVSLNVGLIVSLVVWLLLVVHGQFVPGSETGIASVLHRMQAPGLDLARSWFPCSEPSAPVCEYLKTIPAMIIVNGLLFAGMLFVPIYCFRLFSTSLD